MQKRTQLKGIGRHRCESVKVEVNGKKTSMSKTTFQLSNNPYFLFYHFTGVKIGTLTFNKGELSTDFTFIVISRSFYISIQFS